MGFVTQHLEPIDWAMGHIRQLDHPANNENYHPYLARLSALALPIFEGYEAISKFVITPIKLGFMIGQGFIQYLEVIMDAYYDVFTNGRNADSFWWMVVITVSIYTIAITILVSGCILLVSYTFAVYPITYALITASLAGFDISLLISIFTIQNTIIGTVIKILLDEDFKIEFLNQLKHLFKDTPLHLLNIILSPLLGLFSPTTNDNYHQATGLIQSIPTNLVQINQFTQKYPDEALHALIPPQPIIDMTQILLAQEYGELELIETPGVISILYKNNLKLFKECLSKSIESSRAVYLLNNKKYDQLDQNVRCSTLGYIFLQALNEKRNNCFCKLDDPDLATIQNLSLEHHQFIDKSRFNSNEKVMFILDSKGLLLGNHLYKYLKKWSKAQPEQMFRALNDLKEVYCAIREEINELQSKLTSSPYQSTKNEIFSDVIFRTQD